MSHTAKGSHQKYRGNGIILQYTVNLVQQSGQMIKFSVHYSRTKGVHNLLIP